MLLCMSRTEHYMRRVKIRVILWLDWFSHLVNQLLSSEMLFWLLSSKTLSMMTKWSRSLECCYLLWLKFVLNCLKTIFQGEDWRVLMMTCDSNSRASQRTINLLTVFGYVDHMMSTRPNISLLACEAYIMYSKNWTHDWLCNKAPEDTAKLIRQATKIIRQQFKERHQQILADRRQTRHDKIAKEEENRRKKLQLLEKYACDIIDHGLWQTEREVEMCASYTPTSQQVNALKAQLRFRQHVLQQKADKQVYAFSKNKVELTVQMKENLKSLVSVAHYLPLKRAILSANGCNTGLSCRKMGNKNWDGLLDKSSLRYDMSPSRGISA